ncbi:MAG: hypothetical protein LAP85_27710 [Acidobacteriia bacterium]|nr:hypothetical protein [Terriglobia bacterium]
MDKKAIEKRNRVAQWAFDTSPLLGRFHLWLEDVEVDWIRGTRRTKLSDSISFVDAKMERMFMMTAAVTALGTQLFGRYGEGLHLDKKGLNQVKKDADAISAYAMSESLWYLSRSLPENHAIMVCLGEGLMPKAGETPEMGSNPLLGFGRIYARPQVARFLEGRVHQLINSETYRWDDFHRDLNDAGITVWGTAIDTLENTSRFAQGATTGPLTVLHIFDQPLCITKPYEGYMGNLVLPREVVENAGKESWLVNFFTPRAKVLESIKISYPDIKNKNVHVWTLRGKSRVHRIGRIWEAWQALGADLIDDGWVLPNGHKAFTDSGTYAPTFQVGTWKDAAGETHLFIVDGYAASAEAIQAASLYPILGLDVSLAIFSSTFELGYDREPLIMRMDPAAEDFGEQLYRIFGRELDKETIEQYRNNILQAKSAGIPLNKGVLSADDFLPGKNWDVMAVSGYMLPDPYTGAPGIQKISENSYRVTVRLSTTKGDKRTTFTLRLLETIGKSRLIFNPLLNRFLRGEDYRERRVTISDSGRIRNELQTLCTEALEHFGESCIRLHFKRIPDDVIPPQDQVKLREILGWYKENHPIWFKWLELD